MEAAEFTLARKAARGAMVPVPQTDTGRRGENPKTSGRTLVKELGKMTPVTSGEGVPRKRPQRIGPSDCLAKTQVCAKSRDDVYRLTPAQCRKVKGKC